MRQRRLALDDGSLVDVLDRLLDVGAYVDGTVLLTLADVDLVRLDLRLLLASIETLRGDDTSPDRSLAATAPALLAPDTSAEPLSAAPARPEPSSAARARPEPTRPEPARPEPTRPEPTGVRPRVRTTSELAPEHLATTDDGDRDQDRPAGIAGLVVVLVDIVRKLLERQAIRRMDAGTLTEAEIERLGQALMALEQQTAELSDFVAAHRRHIPAPFPSVVRQPPHIPVPRQTPRDNQEEGMR
jgi:Gas vesicle protein K/Gas vesicle protein